MSDLDLRQRFETATSKAYAAPIDTAADLVRGRRSRRRRRAVQLAAGSSACVVGGAALVVGLPSTVGDGGSSGSDSAPFAVASAPSDGPVEHETYGLSAGTVDHAVREHLGLEFDRGQIRIEGADRDGQLHYVQRNRLHDDGESVATVSVLDDVRDGDQAVPLRCADDPAYETCDRRIRSDGAEIVVGEGPQDLYVAAWGRGGDLIEVTAHWADGATHEPSLGQMIELSADDRVWLRFDDLDVEVTG